MDKRIGKTHLKQPVRPECFAKQNVSKGRVHNHFLNIIFLFLICLTGSIRAAVTLRMTDTQGHELEQVGAGQPFTVEVTITDMGSNFSAPSIQGDSRITLQNRGQQFSTINGNTTAKYFYQGRIDEPGVYALGPATVTQAGQSTSSNSTYITVGTTQKSIGKRQKDGEEILFTLSLDKKRVFVGEQALATLTFYYADDTVALKNIVPPALEGFTVRGDVNNYMQGQEKIKGSIYHYVRWEWQLYPTKPGTLTIPAYGAEYEKLASHNNRFGFELFFAGRNERVRIYSNASSLQVNPLPPHNGPVTSVGAFKQVTATIQPSVAQEGEALVLVLEFEGDGDLDAIKTPELRNMPDALKYYDSKHYIVPSEDTKSVAKKRFEYIVQGMRAGTWQIPSQEFVIFDVEKEAYKTFKTKPLTITITPNAAMQNSTSSQNSVDEQQSNHSKDIISDDLCPLDETGLWYRTPERRSIPLWLFLLLSMLPVLYLLVAMIWRMIQRRRTLREPAIRAKKAFSIARDSLEHARKENAVIKIYPIMIQVIADRYMIAHKEVTPDFIEHQLQKAGMSSIERTKWHDFFMQITEAAYGRKTTDGTSLFAQAKTWIDVLEGIL